MQIAPFILIRTGGEMGVDVSPHFRVVSHLDAGECACSLSLFFYLHFFLHKHTYTHMLRRFESGGEVAVGNAQRQGTLSVSYSNLC